jgi:hypothetical protein
MGFASLWCGVVLLAWSASAFDHSIGSKQPVVVDAAEPEAVAAPKAAAAAASVNAAASVVVEQPSLSEPVLLEHSVDGGASFRALGTLRKGDAIAWATETLFDIATLRNASRAAGRAYAVRIQARPEARGAAVALCEWWHDVRKSVVTVHVDAASGIAYHVDLHTPSTDVPLSCADAALLPAASALRHPTVRVDFGRVERPPRVAEFRRLVAKQRAQSDDQRPWYIKYWYYIVPAVVVFFITSMTGGGAEK